MLILVIWLTALVLVCIAVRMLYCWWRENKRAELIVARYWSGQEEES